MKEKDLHYMRLALQLAVKGQGRTSPNPCVGAVIVLGDQVVGQGYHQKAGTPHAEVHALADAGEKAAGSTLYVTLEPCNHTGRTPPCTEAILGAGIARVVVGMLDPNPTVDGGGCNFLTVNGVDVESGVLEDECRAINRSFIKHTTTGLPWVVMKAGMSLDAKISYKQGECGKITGTRSGQLTHQLRNSLDAILIGVETAIIDNPSLTARPKKEGNVRDPVRVILDTRLRLPVASSILHQESDSPTWLFCGPDASAINEQKLAATGAVIHRVPVDQSNQLDLRAVLRVLGSLNITSVLVEGGAKIHSSMLQQKLVDEVYLFIAPLFIGQQGAPLLSSFVHTENRTGCRLQQVEVQQLGEDTLIHGILKDFSL